LSKSKARAMGIPDDAPLRPLYAKVREQLIERIRSGEWKPGQLIPNEFEVADLFGVSQGTARKAIAALAAEGLVIRQQGRGTFVVEHTPAHVLYRFFNIFDDKNVQVIPDSRGATVAMAKASPQERAALILATTADVIRITRVRTREGRPFICETISLPARLFPGLVELPVLPNTLYDVFQKSFGVLMLRTDDRISAAAADATTAAVLAIAVGTPLLKIDRIGFGLDGRPIEWRVSHCHLAGAHYLARTK
jgi:GntR family transcriptional regulator